MTPFERIAIGLLVVIAIELFFGLCMLFLSRGMDGFKNEEGP